MKPTPCPHSGGKAPQAAPIATVMINRTRRICQARRENGRHQPRSLDDLHAYLDQIDKMRRARRQMKVLAPVRGELVRLWEQINAAKTAQADNGRLLKRRAAAVQGVPIGEWDAEVLGVHRSITVGDETGLTPYLPRPHDELLQARLAAARDAKQATMLVVVGGSSTGKTRTLYQAELADWHVVAPRNDTDLYRLLQRGTPARTMVWLDELQRHLTTTVDEEWESFTLKNLGDGKVGLQCMGKYLSSENGEAPMSCKP